LTVETPGLCNFNSTSKAGGKHLSNPFQGKWKLSKQSYSTREDPAKKKEGRRGGDWDELIISYQGSRERWRKKSGSFGDVGSENRKHE